MNETEKKKILIIEDQAGFRLIYRGVLESDGYEVLEAASGEKGWELAKTKIPDMILLDLILPDFSGYEVLTKIRDNEETKNIPVIIFSVLGSGKDIRKGLELGANDYRIKGDSSPTIILEKIRTLLSK
jgi:DNA-binding response OmpR family regulator